MAFTESVLKISVFITLFLVLTQQNTEAARGDPSVLLSLLTNKLHQHKQPLIIVIGKDAPLKKERPRVEKALSSETSGEADHLMHHLLGHDQKRAVRSIYKLGSRVSLREKFKEIGILTVASQYIYNNIVFVRQNIHLYKQRGDAHNRLIRNRHKLEIPSCRLRKVQKSFVGLSVRLYNLIPKELLDLPLHKFKECVKTHLLSRGYYKVNDFLNDKVAWDLEKSI